MEVGDRVGVTITARTTDDDDAPYTTYGGYGVYEGMQPSPLGMDNPKITLDNGEVVWGFMCWWGPEDKIRSVVEADKLPDWPPEKE